MAILNPLDFEGLLINNIAGTREIFLGLAFIVIAILSAKYRFTNGLFLIMIALFMVFMSAFGQVPFMITMIVIGGLLTAWMLSKTTKT